MLFRLHCFDISGLVGVVCLDLFGVPFPLFVLFRLRFDISGLAGGVCGVSSSNVFWKFSASDMFASFADISSGVGISGGGTLGGGTLGVETLGVGTLGADFGFNTCFGTSKIRDITFSYSCFSFFLSCTS